ncbi:MAG: alpha-amylase family glycosyl hydrolase, partial [Hadesarchaea archaeon]|nr:alpha-amylase family glycosyl hydrolase [Hadesarchaea archaeon]
MKHLGRIKPFLPAALLLFFLIALSSNVSAVSATDEFQTPDWVKDAVFYQIMPDKFRNGDPTNDASGDGSSGDLLLKEWTTPGGIAFPCLYAKKMDWTEDDETEIPWAGETAPTLGRDYHGGDLQGIKEKIPYLKELGVNAVYLNPIYDGPHWHGYSVRDYKSVGRYFGYLKRDEANNPIYDEEAKQ